MEWVAELVRLRRLLALPSPAGPVDPMTTERVTRQAGEEIVEDFLADAAAATGRQLEAIAAPGQVAGLFELAGELVERLEVAGGLRPQQLARRVAGEARQIDGLVDCRELVLEGHERLEPAEPK